MLKNAIAALGFALILAGCANSSRIPGNLADMYPDFPDNEHCFRKLKEYYRYTTDPVNAEPTTVLLPDGKKQTDWMITPVDSPEGYLGILEGRGAVRKIYLVLTPEQSNMLFKSIRSKPEFLVEMKGSYDSDPIRYRVVTVWFKPEKEKDVRDWLEKLVPVETRPTLSVKEAFLKKNKEYILLEAISPAWIEYLWRARQGDIGTVEGLEKRMHGASPELVKYIAQMRKWAELDQSAPRLFHDRTEWEKFCRLAKIYSPFFAVVKHEKKDGNLQKTTLETLLILLDKNTQIVWSLTIESKTTSCFTKIWPETLTNGK